MDNNNEHYYTFVKVSDPIQGAHDSWYLLYDGSYTLTSADKNYLHESLEKSVVNGKELIKRKDFFDRVMYFNTHDRINYAEAVKKNGTILIRQSGSYMCLLSATVIDIRTSKHLIWEVQDNNATIAIIENDPQAEKELIEYLSIRFPNQPYRLLNTFNILDEDVVREMLVGIKTVTFMTTFTSLEWYEKLVRCIGNNKVDIIGYCGDISKWEDAKNVDLGDNNLEIVESLVRQ